MSGGVIVTSELVYLEPSRTARTARISFTITSDTLIAETVTQILASDMTLMDDANILRYASVPSLARKGTAEGFTGSLHSMIPALKRLSDEELEKLLEADENDAPDTE
jgi:hypothetical protein